MRLYASLWTAAVFAALGALPLAAQHSPPSRAFLERTGFLLESAGFRARLANDDTTRRMLQALPAHKFVVHNESGDARYIYADPGVCNCIFTGTRSNYLSYRDMLSNPLAPVDDVAPDYKSQASALLANDPVHAEELNDPAMLDVFSTQFR